MILTVTFVPLALVVAVLAWVLVIVTGQRRAQAGGGGVAALVNELVFERCGDAVVVLDPRGCVVRCNDPAVALLGPLGGVDPARPLHELHPWLAAVGPVPGATGATAPGPLCVEGRAYDARRTEVRDPQGQALASVLLLRDVGPPPADDARVRALAATDEVMGVPNRRHFAELLRRELLRATRYRRTLALLVVRLDRFGELAATHGHEAADTVLRAVVATLVADLRASDSVGRIGDGTFAVSLPERDADAARAAAERAREEVAGLEVPIGDAVLRVTASVAAGGLEPSGPIDPERLLVEAEAAVARAQALGGDRVERYAVGDGA